MNKTKYIIIALIMLTIIIGTISAVNAKEMNTAKGIKEENGQLIDTNNNNKIIGTIQKFDRAEMASRSIPVGDEKTISASPIISKHDTTNGTYIDFTTESVNGRSNSYVIIVMDNSPEIIDKIVEFCKANTKI